MPREDIDQPPASDDEAIQSYLDANYRGAVAAARESMTCIRRIHPELVEHLPETAERHLKNALDNFERALHEMHRAGRHVLGQAEYDEFIAAQTRRQLSS